MFSAGNVTAQPNSHTKIFPESITADPKNCSHRNSMLPLHHVFTSFRYVILHAEKADSTAAFVLVVQIRN